MKAYSLKSDSDLQLEIVDNDGNIYLQSYNTIIALKKDGKIYLDSERWDYSVTIGKYRNMFLHEIKKETLAKIKAGIYTLTNLNGDN